MEAKLAKAKKSAAITGPENDSLPIELMHSGEFFRNDLSIDPNLGQVDEVEEEDKTSTDLNQIKIQRNRLESNLIG